MFCATFIFQTRSRAHLNRENNVYHKLAILEEQIHIEREGTIEYVHKEK